MEFEEYKKYRWFFTSTGKLVVGGKSAEQNDELIRKIKKRGDFVIMHTATPGSPFSVIIADIRKVTKNDLEEVAEFTASFSRLWREAKRKGEIHIFRLSQVSKANGMKEGTWAVEGKIEKKLVELGLVLIEQKGKLRAVPEKTAKEKKILLKISPGKEDKRKMVKKIKEIIGEKFSDEEILNALPSGGVKIEK